MSENVNLDQLDLISRIDLAKFKLQLASSSFGEVGKQATTAVGIYLTLTAMFYVLLQAATSGTQIAVPILTLSLGKISALEVLLVLMCLPPTG
jgi:hypothetical protein